MLYFPYSLVPRPHHARARKGSGDIGADSWFCKLSNHVIICIGFLLAHVRSCDGAQDQENAPMSPDPFSRERLGSGNETIFHTVCKCAVFAPKCAVFPF